MIGLTFKFPALAEKLKARMQQIRNELIVALQTNRGLLFDAEGAYNGHAAWAPLLLRAGQILANRGVLKKSFAPGTTSGQAGPGGYVAIDDGGVTIGTNVASAGLMNWGTTKLPGGVLVPVHAKALMIPVPGGKKATDEARELRKTSRKIRNPRTERDERVIFRKKVKIPARRFDDATAQDQRDFRDALEAALAEALNG